MALHMIKLVVGAATIEDLLDWRARNAVTGEPWILRTRMTPKRAPEMVDGGSVYRVFKGVILCRQKILAVDTVGEGAAARCHVTLDEQVVRVAPTPRRAFQGWRYLDARDAPPDLDEAAFGDVPEALARQLRDAGAW
ncbi:DUF1489 domain-containing protein [Phenylobacterium sp.]|uniref:DUF1489 family protein n=1 Tax=Phenylobacterium sp. TaxID=1871053 RepID=UPI0025E65CA5|nr:DUF1489 domain-containing protein [Phenylobacterium sp.]MBX3483041.1 DUF1489 domain-containing protein [Phenylobacterium sp.]